ncbi:aspartyl-phosphate phosphatase Spo0E family protein [Paenibacillus jiagnxiensis]|uniref:aspartyl-phosphate phosphatase Spo0E family protein n=1 Tax=Paenibacillus jiagnxiensis TaxID=3228926 RepID=UPI0033B3877F
MLRKIEEERRKLNALDEKAVVQFMPLSVSQEIQEQSRKTDELLVCYQRIKATRPEQAR